MSGNALIYTTGVTNGDTVSEGLWPYVIDGYSKSDIELDTTNTWTELSTVEDGTTITVKYTAALDDTEFTTSTESVKVRAAYGKTDDGLVVDSKHDDRTSTLTLNIGVTTTGTSTTSVGTEGCNSENGLVAASGTLDNVYVEFEIDCDTDTVNVVLEYSGYSDDWFGIVFAENMIGNALIC